MDTQLIKLLQNKKVAGMRQVVRGINSKQIRCVLLANDADEHIKRELVSLCNQHNIKIIYCQSMVELGDAVGIETKCATVGLLENGD